MRKELRLRRRKDFDAVFSDGRAWNSKLLVLRALPNDLDHNRYGFVTSKRLGNAVVRNRTRRRLREALRALPVDPGWDIVLSARQPAADADYHELNRAIVDLLTRARLLAQDQPQEATSV
jgi:ribonuclease P protein component